MLLVIATPTLSAAAQVRPGVVIQKEDEGRPRVTLRVGTDTQLRRVELMGPALPAFPTIDIRCDGKARTLPLSRSDEFGNTTTSLYDVPGDAVEAILRASECRIFLPGHIVTVPRSARWSAWADSTKGATPPREFVARVAEIIDGGTIKIELGGRTETVRYIGIDTPEMNHPTKEREPGAPEATEVNRYLVAGQQVRLELDVRERDRDGRLLAYVWVGDRMVNAEMIRRGYAQLLTVPPNVRHQELFIKLHRDARAQKSGLWATPSDTVTPGPSATVAEVAPGVPAQDAWTCPASHPIKGNFTTSSGERCIYHVLGGAWYGKTKPERCYATEEQARRDGCRRSKR